MNEAASSRYEILVEDASGPRSWFRTLITLAVNVFAMGAANSNPGGRIISCIDRETGEEVFRHIEDFGDDEGHLLEGITADLETMTAHEFRHRWVELND